VQLKALLYAKGLSDIYSQFHEHFTSSFCAFILLPKNYRSYACFKARNMYQPCHIIVGKMEKKKLQSQTVIREKLSKALLYEKGVDKMLMKLTPVWGKNC